MSNTNTKTTATTMPEDSLYAGKTAAELVELLNKTEDKNLYAPIIEAIDGDNGVLKAENKAALKAAVKAFAMSANDDLTAFWDSFIRHPYATVMKLTEDKETGEFSLEPAAKRILFTKVDAVYQDEFNGESIANAKNYLRMIARITDNLYRRTCADLSEGVDRECKVIKVAANIDGESTMREIDFTKTSNGGICEQMQAFVDTIMPDGQRVLFRNADVHYVDKLFTNGKDGAVKTGKEGLVERLILDAVAKRYTKTAYEVTSQAACHKSKEKKSERTEKQEEVMSKVPERPEAAATLSKKEKAA